MTQSLELSTKDVTLNRNNFIGGSEIATVMGMSRYSTPLKLWAIKTGKIPAPDFSDNQAVEMGTKLEQFVANLWAEKTGNSVRRAPKTYQHPDYPYMVAHIDRLVTGTDELLECKTTSLFRQDEWQGEDGLCDIPQEYILQVMWYLGITGRKIGHIAVLIGGQQFKYSRIEFDQELFDKMVTAAKDFWENYVLKDVPPAVMSADDETMKELYGDSHTDFIIDLFPQDERSAAAVQELEQKIAYLQELKGQIKDLDAEKKEIEASLKDIIKDNLGIQTPKYKVTWKMQNGGYTYDREAMTADGVFEKYATQSQFRRLNVAKNKEV